jgi:translation initiation factor 2 beta subunit (eIF-2beta)/eIF-5
MDIKIIEQILDTKVKNLEPKFKETLLRELVNDESIMNLTNKDKLLSKIRDKLKLNKSYSFSSKYYYSLRGWDDDTSINKCKEFNKSVIKRKSFYTVSTWIDLINPSTNKNYTIEEASHEIKKRRPTNIEYWLNKKLSFEEATQTLSQYQKTQSKKNVSKHKDREDRTSTQTKYWLNRKNVNTGKLYTADETNDMLRKRQDTVGIFAYISRAESVNIGVRNWIESINNKDRESYISFLLTAIDNINSIEDVKKLISEYKLSKKQASKESLRYFGPLYKILYKRYKIALGAFGSKEMWLQYSSNKRYRYDFTILDKKIIIEYDGYFHYTNTSNTNESTVQSTDIIKTQLAFDNGYTLYRISGKNSVDHNRKQILKILSDHDIHISLIELSKYYGYKRALRAITNDNT